MHITVNIALPPSEECSACKSAHDGEVESLKGDLESFQDAFDTRNTAIENLWETLATRDRESEGLREALADRDREIAALKASLAAKEKDLAAAADDRYIYAASLRATLADRDREIVTLKAERGYDTTWPLQYAIERYDRLREAVEPILATCRECRAKTLDLSKAHITIRRTANQWAAIAAAYDGAEEAEGRTEP